MSDNEIWWYDPAPPQPLKPEDIARGWPHQILVQSHKCTGANFCLQREYCVGLTLCPNVGSVRMSDVLYRIFRFSELRHAQQFLARYDGIAYLSTAKAG